MEGFPEEVLLPPSPLLMLSTVSQIPLLSALSSCLRSVAPFTSPSSLGAKSHSVTLRFETYTPSLSSSSASTLYKPPRKQRSHALDFYESYTPSGLLRHNWLSKHQNDVPSVAALVFDTLDPRQTSPADWSIHETAAAGAYAQLREACRESRSQELVVVLIHGVKPGTSDLIAPGASSSSQTEMMASLKRRLKDAGLLDPALICVVSATDIVSGGGASLSALEATFRERSLSYYQNQTRRIKRVLSIQRFQPVQGQGGQSTPPPASTTTIRARLTIKVAHFQEFRGKNLKALKYYTLAFSILQNASSALLAAATQPRPPAADAVSSALLELRAVADFVSFKIMQVYLSFGHASAPSGIAPGLTGAQAAVMHFQSHVKSFEFATLLPLLQPTVACSHWAWMSRQYLVCAEMLQLRLPRPGLDARPQHVPSYYFHTAALHATRRRKAAELAGIISFSSVPFEWSSEEAVSSFVKSSEATPVAVVTAEAEVVKLNRFEPIFYGGRPRLEPKNPSTDASSTTSSSSNSTLATSYMAVLTLAESQIKHFDLTISLLEKSQALALIDGGVGSTSATATSYESFARGSCFTYNLASSSSRSRIWRQYLVADELFFSGKHEASGKLLLPVAARLKRDKWWAVLVRVTMRLRDCASILRDKNLFASSVLDLISLSTHTSVSKVELLHNQLEQALTDISNVSLSTALIPILLPRCTPLHIAPKHSSTNSTTLVPSHAQDSMQLAEAPLLSTIVSFGRRMHRKNGEEVQIRVIVSSNFPRDIRLNVLRLRFAKLIGDISMNTSSGNEIPFEKILDTSFDININHIEGQTETTTLDAGVMKLIIHNEANSLCSNANLLIRAHGSVSFEYSVTVPANFPFKLSTKHLDDPISAILTDDLETIIDPSEKAETVICESIEAEWLLGGSSTGISFHLWPRVAIPSFGTPSGSQEMLEPTNPTLLDVFSIKSTLTRSIEPCVRQVSQIASDIKRLEDHVYIPRGNGLSHAESHKHFRPKRAPPPVVIIPVADKTNQSNFPEITHQSLQEYELSLAKYTSLESGILLRKASLPINSTIANLSREGRICGKQADFHGSLVLSSPSTNAYLRLDQDSQKSNNKSQIVVSLGCRTKLYITVGNSGGSVPFCGGVIRLSFLKGSSISVPSGLYLVNRQGHCITSTPTLNETVVKLDSSAILGVFVPPLPCGIEFSFPIYIDTPFLGSLESEGHQFFASLYAVRGNCKENEWTSAFGNAMKNNLTNIVVIRERWMIFPRPPLSLSSLIRFDSSYPILDMSPLDGGNKPFVLSKVSDGTDSTDVVSSIIESKSTSPTTSTPKIFQSTPFLVNLSLLNKTTSPIWITDASYVPDGGMSLHGSVSQQIFNTHSNEESEGVILNLSKSLGVTSLTEIMCKSNQKVYLESGSDLEVLLSSPPLQSSGLIGTVSLGALHVSFFSGDDDTVRSVALHLGHVEILDDMIDCNISVPDIVHAGKQAPISIRLENLTAHFQCLEVSSTLPSLEEAHRAGVDRFELADRFTRYTVELLPFSGKKLSFMLLARNAGWSLLPLIMIRSSGIQLPLSITPPRAILVND